MILCGVPINVSDEQGVFVDLDEVYAVFLDEGKVFQGAVSVEAASNSVLEKVATMVPL